MLRLQWSRYFILCVFALIAGCESEEDSDSSSSGSVVPGIVDANGGFNIKINNPTSTNHYIHKAGDFTTGCSVAANETSFANQDITCIVEIEELAGANTGVKMVANAPPGMCKYVWHLPYYYFGLDYGDGPSAVVARFDADGNFMSSGGAPPSSITGPGVFDQNGSVVCNYNYAAIEGPNCCTGDYTLRTITPTSDTTINASWGGKVGDCSAGAGLTMTSRDKVRNLPMGQYHYAGVGFNKEFDTGVRSVIDGDSSIYYANYYSGAAPAAFKLTGDYPANQYYTWTCLDDSAEIVARIRVQIREWNEISEFELEASGDPDTGGPETPWDSVTSPAEAINDFADWLDIFTTGDAFPGMPET